MSVKKRLHEKAKESQKKMKEMEGRTSGASPSWEAIVSEYCQTVEEQAGIGEEKHFFTTKQQ